MRTILSFERGRQRLQAGKSISALTDRIPVAPTRPAGGHKAAPAAQPAVGIFRVSPDGEFLEASPELVAMLGYSDEEALVAASAHDLYADRNELARWLALLDENAGPVVFETAWLRYDGSLLWAHLTSHAVKDDTGCIVFHEGIFEDITARKWAEDELRARNAILEQRFEEASAAAQQAASELESNRRELSRVYAEMEEFVRLAAHDLQEPLRMVSSFLQLISQRYKGKLDTEADKFIGYAVGGAARMKAMIGDLQTYLRLAHRPEAVHPVDCGRILEDVLLDLKAAIDESGSTVTSGELPVVAANPRQLRLVFQNLLSNALKFRGNGGARIHVSAQRCGREWQIAVRDQGIGIAPEHAASIFETFKRLHVEAEYPGTGMGLAVCRKIVGLHGGRIWVDSEAGEGATFQFSMPDAAAIATLRATPAAAQARAAAR